MSMKWGWFDSDTIVVIVGIFLLGLAVGLSIWLDQISTGYGMEILLIGSLVLVTMWYGAHTKRMANEMREQRYDSLRPIVDFEHVESELVEAVRRGEAKVIVTEPFLHSLHCGIRNIGVGPAIDVYSFTMRANGERIRQDFGTIATKGETPEVPLFVEQRDDRKVLVAYYKDIYGRCFESSQEVRAEGKRLVKGPLKIRKIAEEELP